MSRERWRWLGIPWEEADCLQLSLRYLREVPGYPVPETRAVCAEEVEEAFWDRWTELPRDTQPQPLDLITVPGLDGKIHVGVMLPGSDRMVLSSYASVGSRCTPYRAYIRRGVLGVYRWRG